jgi:hypothetical protein
VPGPVAAYLAQAALVHIGRFTHFGCGTFLMD